MFSGSGSEETLIAELLSQMALHQAREWAAVFLPAKAETIALTTKPLPRVWKNVPDRVFLRFEVILGNIALMDSPAYRVEVMLDQAGWSAHCAAGGVFELRPPETQEKVRLALLNWFLARNNKHPRIVSIGFPTRYGSGWISWTVAVADHLRPGNTHHYEVVQAGGTLEVFPNPAFLKTAEQPELTVGEALLGREENF
ncbi:MAG: hypothetical protein K1Y36_29440 [Blastocatellia bacterium]|nr:hypothetical protein [Blastocatellia bacterium]